MTAALLLMQSMMAGWLGTQDACANSIQVNRKAHAKEKLARFAVDITILAAAQKKERLAPPAQLKGEVALGRGRYPQRPPQHTYRDGHHQ